MTDSIIIL